MDSRAWEILVCMCVVVYGLGLVQCLGEQGHFESLKFPSTQYTNQYKPPGYYSQFAQLSLTGLAKQKEKAPCVESFYCGLKKVGHYKIGECVSSRKVCDGMWDCLDGADERHCPPKCHNGVLRDDRKTCGRPCDGKRDCPGGEDEHCPKTCFCGEGTLKCLDEDLCIPISQVCDGYENCLHGNDEEDCSPACLCKEGSYLCKDGKTCIDADKFCDGSNHCEDDEDEIHCPATCFCDAGQYICKVFGDENPTCLTKGLFCNKEGDCPKGDDERRRLCSKKK